MEFKDITQIVVHSIGAGVILGCIPMLFGLAVSGILKIFRKA